MTESARHAKSPGRRDVPIRQVSFAVVSGPKPSSTSLHADQRHGDRWSTTAIVTTADPKRHDVPTLGNAVVRWRCLHSEHARHVDRERERERERSIAGFVNALAGETGDSSLRMRTNPRLLFLERQIKVAMS